MSDKVHIELVPAGTFLELDRGSALTNVLVQYGVEFPCGGSSLCGGCRVRVLEGTLPVTAEDRLVFRDAEIAEGWRLACHASAETPIKIEVGQWTTSVLGDSTPIAPGSREGFGIAVDLGTTTIVAQVIDFSTGEVVGVKTALNPQTAHGADVMSRIRFALQDASLTPLIRQAVGKIVGDLAGEKSREVCEIVLVGNTVMHHLFSGLAVEPLSHVPFESPDIREQQFTSGELDWPSSFQCRIRFLSCIGGFVGSDILGGIAAVGMDSREELCALIDLGTNGEIALGNRDRILCASTAAGPAFEAGSIRMGMRAATGAISRVNVRNGVLEYEVIGDVVPRGICGSGLVDAVAAGLEVGAILPNGRVANGAKEFFVGGDVSLVQSDIRQLQLAKGAIASGLRLLLRRWGANAEELQKVFLSGAFGNYLRVDSALRIGLVEAPLDRLTPAGNTALRGAKQLLFSNTQPDLTRIEHVNLADESGFEETFASCLSLTQ